MSERALPLGYIRDLTVARVLHRFHPSRYILELEETFPHASGVLFSASDNHNQVRTVQ